MSDPKPQSRISFATRFGVIAATAGSAVGLGNIWRFPYEAGNHGGGAFMLLYIMFVLILGIPVICAEFAIGRQGRSNIFGSFDRLSNRKGWKFTGYIGILASLMILSFYSVVAGWTMEYFVQSLTGGLSAASDMHGRFGEFCSGWRCVAYTVAFLVINFLIVRKGVRKGIERMSSIMMPALFVILLAFCIYSLTLPGARQGIDFLFNPDFSKIDSKVVIGALGQAFFSLSIGLGCMLTYASYFKDSTNILKNASMTAGLDTLVAILAGVLIFPAVFTFGASPQEGPTLVFEVLPDIFNRLPASRLLSALFFFMLFLASLTSTISMSEISTAFFSEQFGMSRRRSCILTTAICLVFGALCALSFGALGNIPFFDFFNYFSSDILLPVGGIFICIFAGWIIDRKLLRNQLTNNGTTCVKFYKVLVFCIRYVAPVGLAVILAVGFGII